MCTTAVNSFKIIGIGALFLLFVALGGRWVKRQTPAESGNGSSEIRVEKTAALRSAAPPESALVTPPAQPVSALERLARIMASQPSRPPRRARTSTIGKQPALVDSLANSAEELIQDPVAREALFYVGADSEAEEYWLDAINDPSLSAEERQDLIEDLNEEGLPDPKLPTPEDLPLILRRIELIEAVGPDAMDEANADAFEEAYKDLVNLKDVALGDGRPVN